jgi:hypothetical protein
MGQVMDLGELVREGEGERGVEMGASEEMQ